MRLAPGDLRPVFLLCRRVRRRQLLHADHGRVRLFHERGNAKLKCSSILPKINEIKSTK